jgi:DNA-binding NarL/FixJ family response regulator
MLSVGSGAGMSSPSRSRVIRIGLVADEPIRIAGLASIFEEPAEGHTQFIPVQGNVSQLLSGDVPEYMVVDLHAPPGFATLEMIHREQPNVRLIVIGPHDDDELVMNSIIAGARAYLEPGAGPDTVRQAVEVVISGSIWAPRRLLSRLIDRLLNISESKSAGPVTTLTARERQVMELILLARSNKEIAKRLGIEERTVKAHVSRLMRKSGADNRIKLSMSPLAQTILDEIDAELKESE